MQLQPELEPVVVMVVMVLQDRLPELRTGWQQLPPGSSPRLLPRMLRGLRAHAAVPQTAAAVVMVLPEDRHRRRLVRPLPCLLLCLPLLLLCLPLPLRTMSVSVPQLPLLAGRLVPARKPCPLCPVVRRSPRQAFPFLLFLPQLLRLLLWLRLRLRLEEQPYHLPHPYHLPMLPLVLHVVLPENPPSLYLAFHSLAAFPPLVAYPRLPWAG